jgi:small subunit ribosomal protein S18
VLRKPKSKKSSRYKKLKRKICSYCFDRSTGLDYKNIPKLKRAISERGKILPRRQTGACARHQRWVAAAIKRAREIALLPFAAE